MRRRMLAVPLVLAFAAGCGGQDPKGHADKTSRRPPAISNTLGRPGKLVDIGSGRTLFAHCVGSGSPTVVLEAGFGVDMGAWRAVQPRLGRTARTCAYDRAGLGNSVALQGVHDAREEVDDLQHLLDGLDADPPYVLVGHSYGGLLVRLFAQAHPAETAGLVLVDAMGRDQKRRELAIWPRSQAPALRRSWGQPIIDGVDQAAGLALADRIVTLGDRPLAVVTAGTHDGDVDGMPAALERSLYRLWVRMQDELAGLSTNHIHVVARRSDHFVPQPDRQPGVVIHAAQHVVRAIRDHTPLPNCHRLFGGSDVRCRD